MDLLLLSSSRTPDQGYLEHALPAIRECLATRRRAAFVPFAGVTVGWDEYTDRVREALASLDLAIEPALNERDLERVDAVLVGGGNTFHLLRECRRRGLLESIRRRVRAGTAYVGWSAGSNIASPSIRTTNDMPIVDPGGMDALGFVSFQINPHFTDELPPGHQGERRSDRLAEFVRANPGCDVIALPEGTWIRVRGGEVHFGGPRPARWFRDGEAVRKIVAGPLPASLSAA